MIIYIPFFNEDMVGQVVGVNVYRALSDIPTIPVVCNPLKKGAFLSSVESYKEEESKKRLKDAQKLNENKKLVNFIKEFGPEQSHKHLPLETKRIGEFRALQNISVIEPKKIIPKSIATVYILGYGVAGDPHLYDSAVGGGDKKTFQM